MKKVLLSVSLVAAAMFANAQTLTGSYFKDEFTDDIVANEAEFGYYDTPGLYSLEESDGMMKVTQETADTKFNGFGMYIKPANPLNIASKKTVAMKLTNNGTKALKLRVDLAVVQESFDGSTQCTAALIAKGDSINANTSNKSGANFIVSIPAGETVVHEFDYTTSFYEAEQGADCGGPWNPTYTAIEATSFENVVGLFMVINGGAGESWCADADVCEQYTGTLEIDYLVIGDAPNAVTGKKSIALEVHPNPATSVVNFGRTLTNVSVYNSNGILVETLNSASSINVESFKAGVYLINSTEGSTRFVVK
jgi:hypothetical protein